MKLPHWTEEELEELGPNLRDYILNNKDKYDGKCLECKEPYKMYRNGQQFCDSACKSKYHYKVRKFQIKEYRKLFSKHLYSIVSANRRYLK